jgi:uncharacterized protein (TIGR02266 family)
MVDRRVARLAYGPSFARRPACELRGIGWNKEKPERRVEVGFSLRLSATIGPPANIPLRLVDAGKDQTMTQDTRKDRRAKIVSLNVRYKSATVDEFIDNHSHDVSRGGLFIKTSSPFPPGTLLKFEIRIAGDKAVIAGVGRVVWKRETAQAGPEVPAGMGVKFIKIDDASRSVIDKLVESRGEGRNAYDEGVGDAAAQQGAPEPAPSQPQVASPSPAAHGRLPGASPTTPGLASPAPKPPAAEPAATPFRPSPSASKVPAAAGKATMMGLGGIHEAIANASATKSAPVPAAGRPASDDARIRPTTTERKPVSGGAPTPSTAPSTTPKTSPMFPKSNSEAEMPPKAEQTVMKQAAELLEEALLGAGGSMDEIGQNPLFEVAKKGAAPAAKVKAPDVGAASSAVPETKAGIGPELKPEPAAVEASEPERKPESEPEEPPAEAAATLISAGGAPRPQPQVEPQVDTTVRSATHDEPLPAHERPAPVKARPISERPRVADLAAEMSESPKKNNLFLYLGVAAALVLGGFYYLQVYSPGQTDSPAPQASTPAATVAPTPPPAEPSSSAAAAAPSSTEVPAASAAPSASGSAEPAPSAAERASASASAAAAPAKPTPPVAVWKPPPPKPAPPPPPAASEKPASAAPEAPAATTTPASADSAAPAKTTEAKPTPPPAPKPAAKPKKVDDDNPY